MGSPLGKHHPKVKRLRRLVGRRSARQADRAFVLEGAKVVGEALAAGAPVEGLYVVEGTEHGVVGAALERGIRVDDLAPGVMEHVADTVTPQPIVAVAHYVDVPLDALRGADLVVVCVDVRDPGNAGTVVRSAVASGAGGVVCCDGSVDVYNPKTVRASAGTLFHVPVVAGGDPVQVLDQLGAWGLRRLGTVASGGDDYATVDLAGPTALVLGNEANGLPDHVIDHLDGLVSIPMAGPAESLNVSMATAVLCFEAARQRRLGAERGSPS